MSNVIFYGAGNYAHENFAELASVHGEPCCFADKDNKKWGTIIRANDADEGIPCLSLFDATVKYSDYMIAITVAQSNYNAIRNYLLSVGIPPSKLSPRMVSDDYEYRLGCRFMNNFVTAHTQYMSSCCFARGPRISYKHTKQFKTIQKEDIEAACDELLSWREENIDKLRRNKKTSCYGCQYLTYSRFNKKEHISSNLINGEFKGCTCNIRCIYCAEQQYLHGENQQELTTYDVLSVLKSRFPHIHHGISCAGELSVLPDRESILTTYLQNGWSMQIMTNAVVYNKKMFELLKNRESEMIISLDCGTGETCKRVKQIEAYEKIIRNVFKYAESGGRIQLKYVMLPDINDNLTDINGFLSVADKIRPESIALSFDLFEYHNSIKTGLLNHEQGFNSKMSEQVFSIFTYFVARIHELGLKVRLARDRFSTQDYSRLARLLGLASTLDELERTV
jgi:pyruvate-formate lyase-activating enzyme